jgi:hypothetical protein
MFYIERLFKTGAQLWSIMPATLTMLLTLAMTWLYRRQIRRHVRRQLNKRGIRVCMGCAYQLEGLTEPRCPECGIGSGLNPRGCGRGSSLGSARLRAGSRPAGAPASSFRVNRLVKCRLRLPP